MSESKHDEGDGDGEQRYSEEKNSSDEDSGSLQEGRSSPPKIVDSSSPDPNGEEEDEDETMYQGGGGFSLQEEKGDEDDEDEDEDGGAALGEAEREAEFLERMKEMETQAANRKMAERGVEREREERKEEEVPVASAYRSTESGYKDKAEKDKTEAENENRRLVKKQWDKHPLVTAPYQGLTTKLMQCVVVREKSGNGMFLPSYSLYFQGSDQPAMIALLQGKNRTTNYHIFDMTRGILTKKLSKKSGNYLGKLRSNFSKTENILYTNDSRKVEAGSIAFDRPGLMDQISLGSQPRKLHILLPPHSERGECQSVVSTNINGQVDTRSTMVDMSSRGDGGGFFEIETKEPVFENGNYRLNFHGRVTIPSVKNYQLTPVSDIHDIVCQFGKVGDDRFHLDYKRPLNAFQAFSVALTQFSL
ncbi:hypothetical protein TeGR_g10137 [Tetraparma gracilis]|uniref:Tubby C-terminal domain-containing protein n=1 Tax=Tetraparma gracilis TaxID=2962635 RepID=A0ABQ6MXJ0_9STRA|nr:hypothetical protein TeGR_g10137 [Tetraparma gracilis]